MDALKALASKLKKEAHDVAGPSKYIKRSQLEEARLQKIRVEEATEREEKVRRRPRGPYVLDFVVPNLLYLAHADAHQRMLRGRSYSQSSRGGYCNFRARILTPPSSTASTVPTYCSHMGFLSLSFDRIHEDHAHLCGQFANLAPSFTNHLYFVLVTLLL